MYVNMDKFILSVLQISIQLKYTELNYVIVM